MKTEELQKRLNKILGQSDNNPLFQVIEHSNDNVRSHRKIDYQWREQISKK